MWEGNLVNFYIRISCNLKLCKYLSTVGKTPSKQRSGFPLLRISSAPLALRTLHDAAHTLEVDQKVFVFY